MRTNNKGTMNTITGSPIVTDPALVQSGTIIISHPPVTLAFKRAADGRVHAEYEPGTITEAAQALLVELDRLQAPALRLPGGGQVSGLDAIRARAEAYVSHGTPGLHAPKDRAVLLAAVDAVTALTGRAEMHGNGLVYVHDVRAALTTTLGGSDDPYYVDFGEPNPVVVKGCPEFTPEEGLTVRDAELHAQRRHPAWEYATTEGQRKAWNDADTPPDGEGWERNTDAGRNGWDRFDYTEESYWRRLRPATKEACSDHQE